MRLMYSGATVNIPEIQTAFYNNHAVDVRVVFLGISKVFDKIWHIGLLFKLQAYGVDGKLLSLLKNYLENHEQKIFSNGQTSEWRKINSGAPRGSFLRPLLLLIYINDLPDGVASTRKILADDTFLFSKVPDVNKFLKELNFDLVNGLFNDKSSLTLIPINKLMKLYFLENQKSLPIPLLLSAIIMLSNVLIRNK